MDTNKSGTPIMKKDIILWGILLLIAFGIKLYFLQFYRVISSDGSGYASIAREIMNGKGFFGSTHFPPFYPILIGLMNLIIPDVELAGRMVSMIMGSLIVVPIYLLSSEFFSRKTGLIACFLLIAWPSLRSWSGEVMSQATYITVILTGIYLTWYSFRNRSRLHAVAAGICMGLSYLTRPEAIIVLFAMVATLAAYGLISKVPLRWLSTFIAVILLTFSVLALPYINFLHEKTGLWQISGKTETGLHHALGEYYGKVDPYYQANLPKIGVMDVVKDHPGFLKDNIIKNLKLTYEMVPAYIWIFAFLGFLSGGWSKVKVTERLFLLSTFSPFLILISIFFIAPEYTQLYFPILFLWCANGLLWLEGILLKIMGGIDRRLWLKKVSESVSFSAIIVAILSVSLLIDQIPADRNKPYHFTDDGARYDHKRIGLLLGKHLPKGAKIMTRWGRIGFYADREWVMIPTTSLPEIIETAKQNGVKYIVVDGMVRGVRPQLDVLFQPLWSKEEGILYIEKGEERYRPVVNLKPFLVYKDLSSVGVVVYEVLR